MDKGSIIQVAKAQIALRQEYQKATKQTLDLLYNNGEVVSNEAQEIVDRILRELLSGYTELSLLQYVIDDLENKIKKEEKKARA